MTGDHTSHEELCTGERCRFGKGSIWEILVLDTSGKFSRKGYRFRHQYPLHFYESFSGNCILFLLSLYICVGSGNHGQQYEFWYVFCNPGYGNVYLFDLGDPENCETCRDILCSDLYCSMRSSTSSSNLSSNDNLS